MPPTSMNSHRRLAVVAVAGIVALSSCALGSTADEPTDALDDPTPVARETLSTLPALPDSGSDAAHGSTDTVAGAPMEHHDHAPGRDLVDPARATHTAITDGSWSNPATWTNNAVPGEGSRVTIPAGTVVTIDSVLAPAIKTVGVDGTLRFASDRDTQLRVDTLVSAPTGTLEIGTAERPVEPAVTATVQFADDGPIDRTWDPTLLSRGAILAGTTMVHGAETTHRSTVDSFPRTGDRTISLSAAPIG